MVANDNANQPAIIPLVENPFGAAGAIERYDQLFQMKLQRGAAPDEATDIYLFGFYDVEQEEVVVQLGRGPDTQYGRAWEQMTLAELIHSVLQAHHEYRFTEAAWAGWGDKEAAPAFVLNNPAAILDFRFADLRQENLAASFDLHIVEPQPAQA